MQNTRLKELSRTYNLKAVDFHIQEYGNKKVPFMLKSGIDKITAMENITIDFEPIVSLCIPNESVALKVTGKWKNRTYTTIGEANKANVKVSYLGCMAEKRGRARVILTLTGFAAENVYSADEKWEADQLENSK
jgi:hypothetical protein